MRLVWISDPHFDFVDKFKIKKYAEHFEKLGDAVVYTGDLANGRILKYVLEQIGSGTKPVFYITGNHDFYESSFSLIDQTCRNPNLKAICVENGGPIRLTDSTVMVGAGGWADGRAGDLTKSTVGIADHQYIDDLSKYRPNSQQILGAVRKRADEQQEILRKQIDEAMKLNPKKLLIISHCPIFIETNLAPNRMPSDTNWLPHFSWAGPRQMIIDYADKYPETEFVSLSGHTHTHAEFRIMPNLIAMTAGARYNYPEVYQVMEVE